jgi:K+-sensing histidine kinase KdpD
MFAPGRSFVSRYGGAVLVSAAARLGLDPVLGDTHPFATFFVAVVISAWHGGVGPSLLTLCLGTLSAAYLFIQPRHSFAVHGIGDQVALGLYVFIGLVTTSLCESLRAAQRRAESRQTRLEQEVAERRRVEEQRERLIRQLQEALDTVKTLRGLLPLCAWCKRIRNDRGYWERLETYLWDNLEVEFTHGICPQCAEQVQAEAGAPADAPGPRTSDPAPRP